MPRILLPTFLRNSCCDSIEKANRLGKYAQPGDGHDHYRSLKSGANRVIIQGESFDQACAVFDNMTDMTAIGTNKAALKRLYDWRNKNKGAAFDPPAGVIVGPAGELVVRLEPEFGVIIGGRRRIYQLWTSRSIALPKSVAGMGVLALELGLKIGAFEDCDFYILNLDTGRAHGAKSIPKSASAALPTELSSQEQMYIAQKKKKSAA